MAGDTGKSNDDFQSTPDKAIPDEEEEVMSGNSSGSLKGKTTSE